MRSEIDYTKVGKRIRDARKSMNITQDNLSEMCGCTSKHLSSVENGKKKPSIELLTRLSFALETSIDSFLVDSPASYPKFLIDAVIAEKLSRLERPYLLFLEESLDGLLTLQELAKKQEDAAQE